MESSSINRSHDTSRDLGLCCTVHIYGPQKLIMDTLPHRICLEYDTAEMVIQISASTCESHIDYRRKYRQDWAGHRGLRTGHHVVAVWDKVGS